MPLTDDTGNYWFFDPENLEVMVKVLDGCAVNQHWWVFSSGLTDVGVTLRVEDLETGRTWENVHPKGSTYPPRLDTGAFPCALEARSTVGKAGQAGVPGGAAPPAAVLVVTKTADTDDGSCDHDCSLREAVLRARQWGEGVILLGPGVYTLSIPGANENTGHTGDLDQAGSLVILGAATARSPATSPDPSAAVSRPTWRTWRTSPSPATRPPTTAAAPPSETPRSSSRT